MKEIVRVNASNLEECSACGEKALGVTFSPETRHDIHICRACLFIASDTMSTFEDVLETNLKK